MELNSNYRDVRKRQTAFEAAWAREQHHDPGWPHDADDRRHQGVLEEWLRYHEGMLLGELVPLTLRYLRDNPECAERSQFEHVLVDEYQDLNRAEQSVIDLLSEQASLAVVGDEDQSIYEALRHAHPEGIARFDETHPGTFDVPLAICRRCPPRIVSIATELIQHNRRRIGHPLVPRADGNTCDIHLVQWPTMEDEAAGLADYIHRQIAGEVFEPGRTLILSARRQFGYKLRDELRARSRLAHSFFHQEILEGNPQSMDSSQAQQAFTLLALLLNPSDRVALRCWLGFGSANLRGPEYRRLRDFCAGTGYSPQDALEAVVRRQLSIARVSGIAGRYQLLMDQYGKLADSPAEQVFATLFPADQEWAQPFRDIVEDYVDEWDLAAVMKTLRASISQPELPTNVDYIRIMSLHKSKGLTADHVIVTGFVEGLIPTRSRNLPFEEQMRHIEEQRRLLYVAITRASKTLILSSVLRLPRDLAHNMGAVVTGGNQHFAQTMTSTFLAELGSSCPVPRRGADWNA